jgi:hypothetical protein
VLADGLGSAEMPREERDGDCFLEACAAEELARSLVRTRDDRDDVSAAERAEPDHDRLDEPQLDAPEKLYGLSVSS